ncbi:flagellin lysine-N-methylase [Pantoea anthophila]|uniref:flagellin lysine-N-methylase n=1 Tax=Pantoea anthophila TaxID=470931 RepID=UPI00278006DF|nr:flagellin lysine-N-methylase [Pantoea anthophila]MDQ1214497.1 lysine-N-methylase [Pantoea anthophila]
MKNITVVEPLFVSAFKCIGSECRDHCCKGWDITLDKPTVNRYLKSSLIEIKTLAAENITTTRKSFANWGTMKLNTAGNCAFMDDNRLCKVHSQLGAAALSNTCATYPRAANTFKYEQQKTLALSCPEATRQLLVSPDAMLFEQTIRTQPEANKAKDLDQQKKLLNLMCLNIVKYSGVNLDEAFYALASFLLGAERVSPGDGWLVQMESHFSDVLNNLEQGEIRLNLDQVKPDHNLQWSLLLRLQSWFSTMADKRAFPTLNHYVNKLIYIQAEGAKTDDVSQSMIRLDNAWQTQVIPWLAERPWIMNNYIQYRIYDDFFPNDEGRSPLLSLYLLTAEWFLLKSLIAANVELVGTLQEEDIINIIYSYHSITKHTAQSVLAFLDEIDKVKVNDDLSLIYLLK